MSEKIQLYLLMLLGVICVQSGCEPAFSPIKENDLHYSVFGYLNASADTQYVRIEKLRDSLSTGAPDKLDIEVRLSNLTTGQSELMQDSLFQYRVGKAHNYYSTLDIIPRQSYRLEVIKDGSIISSAEVEIPKTFPEPEQRGNFGEGAGYLILRGIDRLITVKVVYYTRTDPRTPARRTAFQHLQDTSHVENGVVLAEWNQSKDLGNIYPPFTVFTLLREEVIIAAGSPGWPDFLNLDDEEVAIPNRISNVEGGVGFLGGIVTDTVTVFEISR